MSKTFALIGAAGYIAPRHMQAIKEVGGNLVAIMDPSDSVGIIDKFFPDALYFRDEHSFERYLIRHPVDYVSICSPNYLHYNHIRIALDNGADAICEKPLVINPDNYDYVKYLQKTTGQKIHPILQLRYHPIVTRLKSEYMPIHSPVQLNYLTQRGKWYGGSWKGDESKSGGLIYNIGVHMLDLLIYLFGDCSGFNLVKQAETICGSIEFKNVTVVIKLSIATEQIKRELIINGQTYNFGKTFENLHTTCYKEILAGRGLGIEDTRASLILADKIRGMK